MPKTSGAQYVEYFFSRRIYDPRAVVRAAKDYSRAVNVDVNETKNGFRVRIYGAPDSELQTVGGEFCNYVLYLLKAL